MLLECHTLTMNTIVLQLSVADISMLQCSAQLRILIINAHFVVDNATHALASSATAKPTFNVEEEVVVIRNGWTQKEEEKGVAEYGGMLLCVVVSSPSCTMNSSFILVSATSSALHWNNGCMVLRCGPVVW